MQKQWIKPQFHYTYKSEGVILDSQYSYDGNILAVSNSNGDLIFYQSNPDQATREQIHITSQPSIQFQTSSLDYNKKHNAVLKIAWSDPNFSLFATATVQRTITTYHYKFDKRFILTKIKKKKCEWIPISMCFCPIDQQIVLTVGFSDGTIVLYDENLNTKSITQAHQESVNSLSWQNKIGNNSKNQWILQNFPNLKSLRNQLGYPLLLSCSSDMYIVIWKLLKGKLIQLGRVKGHDKQIRQAHWRPNCFIQQRTIVSCSQDGYAKLWGVKIQVVKMQGKAAELARITKKSERNFKGPVYKSSYNYTGTLIAICYLVQEEQKVQTKIMLQNNGVLQDFQK